MAWFSFIVGALFIVGGLFIFGVATYGLFKFNYILNRLHVAAKCDTLASLMILVGLIIIGGLTYTSLKLLFILVFLWLSNPVASHLIAKTESKTNPVFTSMREADK